MALGLGVAAGAALGEGPAGSASKSSSHFPSPPPRKAATVWAVGDGADGSSAGRRVARLISTRRPVRLLYLGDVYETGTAREFGANYGPSYGILRQRTVPTPGNHEWPKRAEGYDVYWAKDGRPPPDHYSFRVAGWQILSLNSEAGVFSGSPQVRWLRRQVSGPGNCRLAFWHRPRFSAGGHGDDPDMNPLWRQMSGKVRLVLHGHEHNMQQLRPRRGVTTLISGAGGRGHHEFDRSYPGLAWGNDRGYGALRLRLSAGRARFAFVGVGGRVLRRGSARCRRPTG